jgi:hypothetical protein
MDGLRRVVNGKSSASKQNVMLFSVVTGENSQDSFQVGYFFVG